MLKPSLKHPLQIIKQLPNSISKSLPKGFPDLEIFDTGKAEYKDALKKLGYNVEWNRLITNWEKLKTLKQNIKWFNPSFSKFVSTNVAMTFL